MINPIKERRLGIVRITRTLLHKITAKQLDFISKNLGFVLSCDMEYINDDFIYLIANKSFSKVPIGMKAPEYQMDLITDRKTKRPTVIRWRKPNG